MAKNPTFDYQGAASHNKQIDVLGAMQKLRSDLAFAGRKEDAQKAEGIYKVLQAKMDDAVDGEKVADAITGLIVASKNGKTDEALVFARRLEQMLDVPPNPNKDILKPVFLGDAAKGDVSMGATIMAVNEMQPEGPKIPAGGVQGPQTLRIVSERVLAAAGSPGSNHQR